jgi:hypothetical protein
MSSLLGVSLPSGAAILDTMELCWAALGSLADASSPGGAACAAQQVPGGREQAAGPAVSTSGRGVSVAAVAQAATAKAVAAEQESLALDGGDSSVAGAMVAHEGDLVSAVGVTDVEVEGGRPAAAVVAGEADETATSSSPADEPASGPPASEDGEGDAAQRAITSQAPQRGPGAALPPNGSERNAVSLRVLLRALRLPARALHNGERRAYGIRVSIGGARAKQAQGTAELYLRCRVMQCELALRWVCLRLDLLLALRRGQRCAFHPRGGAGARPACGVPRGAGAAGVAMSSLRLHVLHFGAWGDGLAVLCGGRTVGRSALFRAHRRLPDMNHVGAREGAQAAAEVPGTDVSQRSLYGQAGQSEGGVCCDVLADCCDSANPSPRCRP